MSRAKRDENLVNAIASSLSKVTDGVISSDGDVFNSNLPEGLTPETVEAVSNYTTAFVASGLEAVGKAAVSAMEEDKQLNDVSAEISMIPQNYVTVTDADAIKGLNIILSKLDESDDVQNVYHNWENQDSDD